MIINKQAIQDFERKKKSNNDALEQVEQSHDKKTWTFFGDMFIKLPTDKTKELIEKDQNSLNERIETAKETIKSNTNELEKMSSRRDLHGFNLGGVTATDLYNNTK
ncbi:unnamed protein product [Mucor hiemalis]